jgi:hypothetical protein
MDTAITLFLAAVIAALLVGYVVLFAYVWRQIAQLIALIGLWRSGKKFFKQIERFRRDFTK